MSAKKPTLFHFLTEVRPIQPSKSELDLKREATDPTSKGNDGTTDTLQVVRAIIEVDRDDYVPPGVTRRQKLTQRMMTAEFREADRARLEADPRVVSIGRPQKVFFEG